MPTTFGMLVALSVQPCNLQGPRKHEHTPPQKKTHTQTRADLELAARKSRMKGMTIAATLPIIDVKPTPLVMMKLVVFIYKNGKFVVVIS